MSGNQSVVFRRPVSVLVVVYSEDGFALLLKRAAPFEMWQSVTGSLEAGESHADAAARELFEETGLTDEGTLEATGLTRRFMIDPRWRHRFAPGVIENAEHEWLYRLPSIATVVLNDNEHSEHNWLPISDAVNRVWSWTNREALQRLVVS